MCMQKPPYAPMIAKKKPVVSCSAYLECLRAWRVGDDFSLARYGCTGGTQEKEGENGREQWVVSAFERSLHSICSSAKRLLANFSYLNEIERITAKKYIPIDGMFKVPLIIHFFPDFLCLQR